MLILLLAGIFGVLGAIIGFFNPDKIGFKSRKEAVHTGIFALALLAIWFIMSGEPPAKPVQPQQAEVPASDS